MTTTEALLSYHGRPELKAETLAQLAEHRRHDQIVQGTYWDPAQFKGCAVGCLTHDSSGGHDLFPERWGMPVWMAHLVDDLFEALPVEEAREWPQRIMGAIPVGADLHGHVWPRLAVWLLADPDHGVLRLAAEDDKSAIRAVADCYARRVAGDEPSEAEWQAAGETARARSALEARAAREAWEARAARAARTAWTARRARTAREAREAREAWEARAQCDQLVHLCQTAPTVTVTA